MTPPRSSLRLLLIFSLCFATVTGLRISATLNVPEGFSISPAAKPSALTFPMFAALDDRGRLFVTESSGGDLYGDLQKQTRECRVRLLEDRERRCVFYI